MWNVGPGSCLSVMVMVSAFSFLSNPRGEHSIVWTPLAAGME